MMAVIMILKSINFTSLTNFNIIKTQLVNFYVLIEALLQKISTLRDL
jgi:hypothetical protein